MSTVLANQINIFRPNSGRIFHRVRGKDCTRPCFIEWLKGMHSFCAKSKKTQFSNKAYLSNGTRFPVLKGRTMRGGGGGGGGGGRGRENTKKIMDGKVIEKDNRAKKKWRKKLLQSEFHRRAYKLYPIKRHLGSLYRSFVDPGGMPDCWFSLQSVKQRSTLKYYWNVIQNGSWWPSKWSVLSLYWAALIRRLGNSFE